MGFDSAQPTPKRSLSGVEGKLISPNKKAPANARAFCQKRVITPIFLTEALNQTNRRLNHSQPLGKSVLLGLC